MSQETRSLRKCRQIPETHRPQEATTESIRERWHTGTASAAVFAQDSRQHVQERIVAIGQPRFGEHTTMASTTLCRARISGTEIHVLHGCGCCWQVYALAVGSPRSQHTCHAAWDRNSVSATRQQHRADITATNGTPRQNTSAHIGQVPQPQDIRLRRSARTHSGHGLPQGIEGQQAPPRITALATQLKHKPPTEIHTGSSMQATVKVDAENGMTANCLLCQASRRQYCTASSHCNVCAWLLSSITAITAIIHKACVQP